MQNRAITAIFAIAGVVAVLAFSIVALPQTSNQATTTPTANPAGSNPDLSGVWTPAPGQPRDRNAVIPPEQDFADYFTYRHSPYPMQPWAEEKFNYNRDPSSPYIEGRSELNPPAANCFPLGPMVSWLQFYPFEIIQSAKRVLIIHEEDHEIRQIWTDGRQHPKDFGHTWMGHSIGHWEGNTLVADTIGLNDKTWLDLSGHVHSDQLHLIEKFSRVGDRLTLEITFDDPKAFTTPWTARKVFQLKPNWNLEEGILCEDKLLGKGLPLH